MSERDQRDEEKPEPYPEPPKSGIYWTILAVLVGDVVIGAVIALFGDLVLKNEAIKLFGVGLALLGAVLYVFFRIWGRKWLERREQQEP